MGRTARTGRPEGPDGVLDPGLLRLAFKTLRKAGHDPLREPDAAELIELLVPVYTPLAVQRRRGRPIDDAVLDLILGTIRRTH